MITVVVLIALLVGFLAGAYVALSWATSHTDHPSNRRNRHHV